MAQVIALRSAVKYINGKTAVSIKKGHIYQTSSAAYKRFSKEYFIAKPRIGNQRYSREEFTAMVNIYLANCDSNTNLEDYWQQYQIAMPTSNALRSGVICYMCIIRGLDNTTHYQGFKNPAHLLQDILFEVDPMRFDVTSDIEDKLDALLATI